MRTSFPSLWYIDANARTIEHFDTESFWRATLDGKNNSSSTSGIK